MREIMGYLLIQGGTIVSDGKQVKKDILIKDGMIEDTSFQGELPLGCVTVKAEDRFVSSGFIDMHVHGGGGGELMDCTEDSFRKMSALHLKYGTTTMVPTAVTSSRESYERLFRVFRKYSKSCINFYGIHLEGPFLSPKQKGAHKEKFLHAPTEEDEEFILSEGKGIVKRITAAPELPGMFRFSEHMAANGIGMIVGHSDATSEIAIEAFDHGFSHITHFYNATSTWRKINQVLKAGVIEAGYLRDDPTLELIADGKHVAVDCGRLARKIKGVDNVCFVTDALRPAGEDVTESYIGEIIPENRVIIEDGVAKLPDRSSFAGSIATSQTMLKTGVNYFGFTLEDTVTMLTKTPARILGYTDIGVIEKGKRADLVIFDRNLDVQNVICQGNLVR